MTAECCDKLCASDFKEFLVWELSIEDKDYELQLRNSLEFLWLIVKDEAMGNLELHYLYAKLELLKVLMGCYYGSHDITQGRTSQMDTSNSKRQENTHGGAQSSNHSYSESDSCAISEYNDRALGFMRAYAKRLAHSETVDRAKSKSTDKSRGASRVDGCSDEFSNASSEAENSSSSSGVGRGEGLRKGREYEFNQSTTQGQGNTPFVSEWSLTSSGSSWDRDMFNRTKNNDSEKREGKSFRKNVSANKSNRDARRVSCSFFQTNTLSCSQGTSDMFSCDTSRSTRDAEASASGEGFSKATYDARSVSGSQGSAENHSDHEFKSVGQGYKTNKLDVIKDSQKFRHLVDLYDSTKSYLNKVQKIVKAGFGHATAQSVLPVETYSCIYTFTSTLYCRKCCRTSTTKCGCNRSVPRFSYGLSEL